MCWRSCWSNLNWSHCSEGALCGANLGEVNIGLPVVGGLLFGGVGEGFVLELHACGGVGVGVIDGIPQQALLSGDEV